jgi:hypothetical protein
MMPTIPFPVLHLVMTPSSDRSSICDGAHSEDDYNDDDNNDCTFAYASSMPCCWW